MTKWLICANSKVYNCKESFNKNSYIDWVQMANYEIGDIVYIYQKFNNKNISNKIAYKTKVVKVDMKYINTTNDDEFWIIPISEKRKQTKYARLELIKCIDNEYFTLDKLRMNGLKNPPQKAMKIFGKLENYINQYEDKIDKDNNMKNIPRNQILYGPPGTGKTYNTIIKAMEAIKQENFILASKKYIGENSGADYGDYQALKNEFGELKKQGQIEFVTFHQSYSYEEFVEGIKPATENGNIKYDIENGIFKNLCIKANANPDRKYVILIDEINRGNISKIFGELITLIESDKRINPNGQNEVGDKDLELDENSKTEHSIIVTLPYSKKPFGVPKNLYIIGTMNTSDRSIASVDIALRRRFKFVEMMPDSSLLNTEVDGINLQTLLDNLNERITVLLDRDHQIGHSYFMKVNSIEKLEQVWYDSIIPLLNEYFYTDWEKLKAILGSSFISEKECNNWAETPVGCETKYCEFIKPKDFKSALKTARLIKEEVEVEEVENNND